MRFWRTSRLSDGHISFSQASTGGKNNPLPPYDTILPPTGIYPQIPEELASSTVRTPAFEQLQIVQQQLLIRSNMLDIARKLDVFPDVRSMSPDAIVEAMRARTTIRTTGRGAQEAPFMTVSFEAPKARTTAEVLNEYLVLIQRQDTEFRKGRSGETLDFFQQEVARLGEELNTQSARILEFKQANSDALPESLQYRLDQQSVFQDRLIQIDRDISDLKSQGSRLVQLYELTGGNPPTANGLPPKSAEEQQLDALNAQLREALAVYSPENPRVKLLEARIAQLKEKLEQTDPAPAEGDTPQEDVEVKELPPILKIQLTEIANRVQTLESQKASVQVKLDELSESIDKTPEVSIALEELERKYHTLQQQYDSADARLAKAQTGDRIETRSRGQRISVVEQPSVPTEPTKPNRLKIATAGVGAGIAAGLGLVLLLEMLNTSARRPVDIVNRLGVTPLTTIPYVQTGGQRFRQFSLKLLLILAILGGIPAAVYLVHTYYLPLDLLADKVMNKLGVRW